MSPIQTITSHAHASAVAITVLAGAAGSWVYAQSNVIDDTTELVGAGGLLVFAVVMGRVIWNLAQVAAGKTDGSARQLIDELRHDRDYWREQALNSPSSPKDSED